MGSSKIPTTTMSNKARCAHSEAIREGIEEEAEETGMVISVLQLSFISMASVATISHARNWSLVTGQPVTARKSHYTIYVKIYRHPSLISSTMDCNTAADKTSSQEAALASAKWIYSNAQRTASYRFRRSLELVSDTDPFVLNEDIPEPGRSDAQTVHLRAYKQHLETIRNFKKDLWASYGHLSATNFYMLDLETWQRLEKAEGDERKKVKETCETLEWIDRSSLEEGLVDELGYSVPWERLHPDSPGPFLSLGTHFWALIIGNDNYLGVPALGGCINDAHLVKDYLMKYLQVPEDHIVLLENACRNEMIDALYNLRDNERISFGDNILVHYSGYGSSYDSGVKDHYIEAICPIDRGSQGSCDISERELDAILSELCSAKGPKITFIPDCSLYDCGCIRSDQEGISRAFRFVRPLQDGNGHMLKLGMDDPRRRSNVDIFSENWERDLTSFVQLSPGWSTIEVDVGLGKGRHGLFTIAVIKVLESEEGRRTTYEGLIQLIGSLREDQIPEAIGTRKASLLWFRDTTHLDRQDESSNTSVPSACLLM